MRCHWQSCALLFCVLAMVAAVPASSADAAVFASSVVEYVQGGTIPPVWGANFGEAYTDPNTALGPPDGVTGQYDYGWPNVLSPFSAAYDHDQVVAIGEGGHLTLGFAQPIAVAATPTLGIVSTAGLADSSWPNGVATTPATLLFDQAGTVEVSQDGNNWVSLGTVSFDMPANYYLNAGPYDAAPPAVPQVSSFDIPFTPAGGLSAFDGLTNSQIVSLMGGSIGGTWLTLAASGLSEVNFIRFSVADDGDPFNDASLAIDSVFGQPVPEPGTLALLACGGAAAAGLVRRRGKA